MSTTNTKTVDFVVIVVVLLSVCTAGNLFGVEGANILESFIGWYRRSDRCWKVFVDVSLV